MHCIMFYRPEFILKLHANICANVAITDSWLKQQTEKTDPDGYDEIKAKSGHPWLTLPESVMGTLVYFMMVAHILIYT